MSGLKSLCEELKIPEEVTADVLSHAALFERADVARAEGKLFSPPAWEQGLSELNEAFGGDERGMKMLACQLHCALAARREYRARGIGDDIFLATMDFIPRFLERHKRIWGEYAYTWGWWFPRQLSLREFRIGALEFELTGTEGEPKVFLHIPSGADIGRESVLSSCRAFRRFLERFFPLYAEAELFCESWLLAPQLRALLPPQARILQFQSCFTLLDGEGDESAFMDWVYGRRDIPLCELPEETLLQRQIKRHLLDGGKISWRSGKFTQ